MGCRVRTLTLSGGDTQLSVNQLSYSGDLWIGEARIEEPVPSGTVGVSVTRAADRNGNVMAPYAITIPALIR